MLKKISAFFITMVCITLTIHPMEDVISLDDALLFGPPSDWKPILEKHSLQKILKTISSHKNYTTMTDSHGNNLMLAFIDYHYQIYSNCRWVPDQKPLKKRIYHTIS